MKFMIKLETTVNTNFTGSFEFGSLSHTTSDMLLQHTCWCLSGTPESLQSAKPIRKIANFKWQNPHIRMRNPISETVIDSNLP